MSAPTINPSTDREVSLEVIDLYTEDAAGLGPDRSAEIAGLLAATVDTFFMGDRDRINTSSRDEAMAEKIEQAYEVIRDLPCLCSGKYGMCRRCAAIGDDMPDLGDLTDENRAAWVVGQALINLGLFTNTKDAHAAASRITFALWAAGKLVLADRDTNTA